MYRVRNGKGYAKAFVFTQFENAKKVLKIVNESIIEDMSKNVKGKKIYIPENFTYTLPATEKQFVGFLPAGSYVSTPTDIIVGVHWTNTEIHRVDLDLSLMNIAEGKIGWDASYRTSDGKTLFSGDITDAPLPKGATEAYYIARKSDSAYLMVINYFNHKENESVPTKIFASAEKINNMKNYMVNPNNVLGITDTVITDKQKVLGLIISTTKESRFYFVDVNIGKGITSTHNEYMEYTRKYLIDYYNKTISLNDMLVKAGAELVKTKEECDIDLSIETLEKDSILKLLI